MYFHGNETDIYVNESIFSGSDQEKVYKYAQSAVTPSTTVVDTCLRQLLSVLIHNSSFNITQ